MVYQQKSSRVVYDEKSGKVVYERKSSQVLVGRARIAGVLLGVVVGVVVFGGSGVSRALAARGAWWHVVQGVRPSNIAPGGEGLLTVQALNVGDGPTVGTASLSVVLPAGLSVVEKKETVFNEGVEEEVSVPEASFFTMPAGHLINLGPGSLNPFFRSFEMCSATSGSVTCTLEPAKMKELEEDVGETGAGFAELKSFENFEIRVKVKADPAAVSGVNHIEVSGGGAPVARVGRVIPVSAAPVVFGVEDLSMVPEEEGGEVDVQAGSHPFQFTTGFSLNQGSKPYQPPALPRNIAFKLPAGMVGNATVVPQCTDQQFEAIVTGGTGNRCPQASAVGVVSVTADEPITLELQTLTIPLFNLTPEVGEPARFGFEFAHAPVTLDTSVRTGSDYGITATVSNITQLTNFLSSTVTLWGVPGDSRHDGARGWGCLRGGSLAPGLFPCETTSEVHPPPFLTMPTACSQPYTAGVEGVSWPTHANPSGIPLETGEHGSYTLKDEFERTLSVSGCNRLPFSPSIVVQPDVQSGSTPSGLTVRVRVPQEDNENAQGLESAAVKDTTVTLPEGVQVNPAGAGGLESCSETQIGFQSITPDGTDLFTPGLADPFCPDASKIGTVKFKIPLIKNPIEGSVYLASQNANPFASLVAMYIVAEDPVSGILLKLAGEVHLTETGQLVTTLRNSPQAPLEEAEFHFFGGARAPLSTPAACGSYTTQASFTPWSDNPPINSTSRFDITSGPNGTPCQNPLPFAPTLAAGTTNIQAGAFTTLTTTISREDGNQDIQGVQLHMPPGFSGTISNITPCPEPQANQGTCGPQSLIGHTIVSVGLGSNPYSVTGGQVFLTGPYKGAPFGLSIVNPAKAGPFDLGNVTVRAKLDIDPVTAQVTVTTDPTGPHAIPHILDGIPLQIKHVNVTIDRPGFAFNPTNCNPLTLTGNIQSTTGTTMPVSVPFQITNCATLKFNPKLTVTTNGHTSKTQGASLTTKLTYPPSPQGTQTNIAKVKVELPKQLPSRLTTLQKACLAKTFETNPANCPPQSIIGHATVHTPLLPVPLTGPAYFVSHGGEAFPSLTIILQGDNVTIQLTGTTHISKQGITSTTFKTTPDTPFTTFELTLPQGPYSALAANGNLCKTKLTIPTQLTAQNGTTLNQNTPITTTNCHKHHHKHKHTKHH